MDPFDSKLRSSKSQTFLRWIKSREQRIVELQLLPIYWKLRHQKARVAFFLKRLLFRIKGSFEERKEWNASRFIIFKVFLKPFIFALLVVLLFEMSASLVLRHESFLKLYLPVWMIEVWDWLRGKINLDIATYRSLLGPLITVSGAFLGLYFTALNVLLSSTYKQVTADVRKLLIRDKIGNTYTRIVAFTGAYSLILFGLVTTGYTPRLLSLILLVCLGITEIYCFLSQWFRLFNLFDPSMLANYLMKDLASYIKEATIKGNGSQDISFQNYFQRQAEENLDTYRNLITTVKSEEHLRSKSLIKLANSLLSLLWLYEIEKPSIPSQSKWFKTTFEHKDWITASHSETSIAAQTGTTLMPKEVPDLMWMEKEIGKIIDFALKGFLEKHDLTNALNLFNNFQRMTHNLAQNYSIEEALLLFRIIKHNSQSYLETVKIPEVGAENDLDSLRFTLALVDFYALSFINILLGISEGANDLSLESLQSYIEETDWKNNKSLYRKTFPRKILQELETSKKHLDFESTVEGKIVTPAWYQLQLLTLSYFRFLDSTINSLLLELQEVFLKEAQSLIKEKKHVIAIHLIERGFEACNKFAYHFHSLEKHCQDLSKARILTDVPSVNFSWEDYQKRIESVHEQLVILFSQLLYQIMRWPRIEDLPDYFGHVYTILTEECLKAMAKGNEELFKNLFPTVFDACIAAHKRQTELDIIDIESKFVIVADPIVDLFDLSGYSIIFQEIDGKEYWKFVQSIWDKYFSDVKDRLSLIKLLITLGTHQSFIMSPRSITRTSWQQYITRTLRERGLIQDNLYYDPRFGEENTEQPPSKIIKILTRSLMLHDKALELFVATYFKNEIEKDEIDVSGRIRDLHEQLFKEESV